MPDAGDEQLNIYDADGVVIGARPRREAKASGLAVGAVNALLVDARGRALLQRRRPDKENGGLWDKSVGGHVAAGEEFDTTLVREAGEELFDDPAAPQIRLAGSADGLRALLDATDLARAVVLRRFSFQRNLRDVRRAPGGGIRNVIYHLAIYLGRTDVPIEEFRPQATEIEALAYFEAAEVDRMLADGELAPNMAFLWLTHAHALLGLVPTPR
jgi:isopentenyldiphosphate isomerase